ncbi:MAG: sn-glycerol-1-phosphate dehydrogenase [Deltaproteobacteria bacterium]|nr:sn-glycerol-1-phosphate dehydrogenase [Deltaproteobacteria bacterium]
MLDAKIRLSNCLGVMYDGVLPRISQLKTMKLDRILDRTFRCACGQDHHVPVKGIFFSEDALRKLPEFLARHVQEQKVLLVSDIRTHEVAGREAEEILRSADWSVEVVTLTDSEKGGPVCDDSTYQELLDQISDPPGVCIAVGTGVINDLVKWASFHLDRPYVVIATAASMNGFTSANVAPLINGIKSLVRARAAIGVFAKPSVLANAPYRLTAAGLGDALAKSVSVVDWEINHLLRDEHFCSFCAEIINEIEPIYFNHPESILARSLEGIKAIFDALNYSGLAMTMIGSSAPASGGEHLFSHTLDMMSLVDGVPHDLHGRQVGLGTIFACALYDRLLRVSRPRFCEMPDRIDRGFWGRLGESLEIQYGNKLENISRIKERLSRPDTWDQLQQDIFVKVKSPALIAECLQRAGAARYLKDIGCGRERARQAALHLHEIRARFTVVDLAWMVGVLPEAADEIVDEWLLGDT